MVGLVAQINEARVKKDWSVARLLDEAGLDLERSTLHRKLHGDTPMTDDEVEKCARALDLVLVYRPEDEAAAS